MRKTPTINKPKHQNQIGTQTQTQTQTQTETPVEQCTRHKEGHKLNNYTYLANIRRLSAHVGTSNDQELRLAYINKTT